MALTVVALNVKLYVIIEDECQMCIMQSSSQKLIAFKLLVNISKPKLCFIITLSCVY